MKSEMSSLPHVVHTTLTSFSALSYSNWYVGVSHCRQIRYSGSLKADEVYRAGRWKAREPAVEGCTKRATCVALSRTEA